MLLEGYPGAAIEKDLFPLKPATWVFQDRLDKAREPLRLTIRRSGDGYVLAGVTQEQADIAERDGYIEIRYKDRIVERPLKVSGKVGDTWRAGGEGLCTAYGYDRVKVLGKERRALVVAVERGPERNFYWFVAGMGWVRIRTERQGRAIRDALLISYSAN